MSLSMLSLRLSLYLFFCRLAGLCQCLVKSPDRLVSISAPHGKGLQQHSFLTRIDNRSQRCRPLECIFFSGHAQAGIHRRLPANAEIHGGRQGINIRPRPLLIINDLLRRLVALLLHTTTLFSESSS